MAKDHLKKQAAEKALSYVKHGMKLGIGTGSTAEIFIQLLAEKIHNGLEIIAVPTSKKSADLCEKLSIPLHSLDDVVRLDLTIDGADEISPQLHVLKGGGGALLYEKIVAASSDSLLIIADESKCVQQLGAFPLPIEVNIFGWKATCVAIEKCAQSLSLSGTIKLRMKDDKAFITDGGHYILDAGWGCLSDPQLLSQKLLEIPGIVEHGLFIGLARQAVIAQESGALLILSA